MFLWQPPPSVLWTLPIELQYYLALPLILFLFHAVRTRTPVLFLLSVCVYLVACYVNRQEDQFILATLGIHKYTLVFVTGSLTGLCFERLRTGFFAKLPGGANAVLVVALLAVFLAMNPVYFEYLYEAVARLRGRPADYVYAPIAYYNDRYLIVGLLLAVFILASGSAAPRVRRMLTSAPVLLVGRISYSMYLLHMPVLDLVRLSPLPPPLQGLAVIAMTILLSAATYFLVEQPCIALGRRLSRRAVA
jgi:peptidoglycan/LPS O-acetylase OafA/YrhL